jgi:hypothetical protein
VATSLNVALRRGGGGEYCKAADLASNLDAARVGGIAMVDMAAITGFAASVRAAVEITKAMKDVRDANLLQTKTFELTREILAAQGYAMEVVAAQSALLDRIRELEEEKAKLEAWNIEKQRYELKKIQAGVTVYALKPGMENGEEPHFICTNCYQHGQKSILQREQLDVGRVVQHVCHQCGAEYTEFGLRQAPSRSKSKRQ